MRAVFEVLLQAHPAFTEFRDDGDWGWAKKAPGAPRRLTLQTATAARRRRLARALWVRLRALRRRLSLTSLYTSSPSRPIVVAVRHRAGPPHTGRTGRGP